MGVCAFLLFNHVIMMDDPYEMPRRLNVLQCTYFLFMSGCGEDRSRGIMCGSCATMHVFPLCVWVWRKPLAWYNVPMAYVLWDPNGIRGGISLI
jgi:hypothetical protein